MGFRLRGTQNFVQQKIQFLIVKSLREVLKELCQGTRC